MPISPPSRPSEPSPAIQAQSPAPGKHPAPTVLQSTDLLGAKQSVEIEHKGQMYRLQATRQGKLILTK